MFFVLLAGLSLGVALKLPILNGVSYLPLFDVAMNGRLRLVYAFALAILAGLGLDRLIEGERNLARTALRFLVLFAAVSLILIVPTYLGDEAWFASEAFRSLLPGGWRLEPRRLDELLHPSLL